jgi:hypothetical protein
MRETSFHACSGCSAMFLNPSQFQADSTANPSIEMRVMTQLRRRRR